MSLVFFLVAFVLWFYSSALQTQINETWATKFVRKQIIFDKNRTLLPIIKELELVQKMVHEPDLIAMSQNEADPQALQRGIALLEHYRILFEDHSYFAALLPSGHYYFNDSDNRFEGNQLRYTLQKDRPDDRWFFNTLAMKKPFSININKDTELGIIKVWINVQLRDNNHVRGVIGTGFDFEQFLKESVGLGQEGVHNFFIDNQGSIQLARDSKLIDYASITKADGQHNTLSLLIKDPVDMAAIRTAMNTLSQTPDAIKTLWVNFQGKQYLLGIAYLKEIDWFSLTFIDTTALDLIESFSLFPILLILFFSVLVVMGIMLHTLLLRPINQLKTFMLNIGSGNYHIIPPVVGSGEIADLSLQFRHMVEMIHQNNLQLEQKIQERTQSLKHNEEKLNTILESVDAYIYIKDRDYRYIYANKKVCDYFQKPLEAIIGHEDSEFFDLKSARNLRENDRPVFEEGRKVTHEEINTDTAKNVTTAFLSTKIPLRDDHGNVYALCGISTDITERIKNEHLIRELAYFDALTHLPNRRMIEERLGRALASSRRNGTFGAFMMLDLDNFKPLNDKHGHHVGDLLLIEAAHRLSKCVREVDTVGRFGGDEFIVILEGLNPDAVRTETIACEIAEKIRITLLAPYHLTHTHSDGRVEPLTHRCSVSIGVTLFDARDASHDKIFQRADRAMYRGKEASKNSVTFIYDI